VRSPKCCFSEETLGARSSKKNYLGFFRVNSKTFNLKEKKRRRFQSFQYHFFQIVSHLRLIYVYLGIDL
jgi:hypothetical protein